MGDRSKGLGTGAFTLVSSAVEKLPAGIREAPGKATKLLKDASLPEKIGKFREALPVGKKDKKPTKLERLGGLADKAMTVATVAVAGRELYEVLKSSLADSGSSSSRKKSGSRSSGSRSRASSGRKKSSTSRSRSSGGTKRSSSSGSSAKRSSTDSSGGAKRSSSSGTAKKSSSPSTGDGADGGGSKAA